jgi:signal peptidase II
MQLASLFAAVVVLDQFTKWLVKHAMLLGQSVPVLGDFIRLTYVENRGIAFGLRVGNGTVFTFFSAAASLFIVYYLWKQRKESATLRISLLLILAGAVGNLIDRIAFGRVVDFVDVGIKTLRWPVFNVADSSVVVGMGVMVYLMIREESKNRTGKADASAG